MTILGVTTETTGLVGVLPRIVYIRTDDTLSDIMDTGYLTKAADEFQFSNKDVALVSYKNTRGDREGKSAWLEINKNGDVWTLLPTQPAGSVTLPVTDNAAVRFNGTGGALQDSAMIIDDNDNVTVTGSVAIDNLTLDGNSISSTNTDGDIVLAPDGTGPVEFDSTTTTVNQDVTHKGDTDNLIKLETDSQKFQTGGTARMTVTDSGVQIGSGVSVTTILDDDSMTADSATSLVTQQSFKAYADAAAGGGATSWTYVKLATTQTTMSTTHVDITGLNFTPAADTSYEIQFFLLMQSDTASRGWGVGFTWPTGLDDGAGLYYAWDATTPTDDGGTIEVMKFPAGDDAEQTVETIDDVDSSNIVEGRVLLLAGSSVSGDFQMTFEIETGTATASCMAGSFIRYYAYA